jgi:hypothetical protein
MKKSFTARALMVLSIFGLFAFILLCCFSCGEAPVTTSHDSVHIEMVHPLYNAERIQPKDTIVIMDTLFENYPDTSIINSIETRTVNY